MKRRTFPEFFRTLGRRRGHRPQSDIAGAMYVYKSYRLPPLRHDEPFSKRRAGKMRRDERRFVLEQKRNMTWNTSEEPS